MIRELAKIFASGFVLVIVIVALVIKKLAELCVGGPGE